MNEKVDGVAALNWNFSGIQKAIDLERFLVHGGSWWAEETVRGKSWPRGEVVVLKMQRAVGEVR